MTSRVSESVLALQGEIEVVRRVCLMTSKHHAGREAQPENVRHLFLVLHRASTLAQNLQARLPPSYSLTRLRKAGLNIY